MQYKHRNDEVCRVLCSEDLCSQLNEMPGGELCEAQLCTRFVPTQLQPGQNQGQDCVGDTWALTGVCSICTQI